MSRLGMLCGKDARIIHIAVHFVDPIATANDGNAGENGAGPEIGRGRKQIVPRHRDAMLRQKVGGIPGGFLQRGQRFERCRLRHYVKYANLFPPHSIIIINKKCFFVAVEIEQMLETAGHTLHDAKAVPFDWPWDDRQPTHNVWAHEMSGSGGYSDHIFKYAAHELFGITVAGNVTYKNLRNPDFKEVILERDGKVLLRFAIANGFRNIQNLVQKLKRGKSTYHYVEVMACPSGNETKI